MTTTTTISTVVCPPWCDRHWPCDQHLGNPDRKYQHETTTLMFGEDGIEGGVDVDLSLILHDNGDVVNEDGCGPSIYVARTPLSPAAARDLAEHILSLVKAVEQGQAGKA